MIEETLEQKADRLQIENEALLLLFDAISRLPAENKAELVGKFNRCTVLLEDQIKSRFLAGGQEIIAPDILKAARRLIADMIEGKVLGNLAHPDVKGQP